MTVKGGAYEVRMLSCCLSVLFYGGWCDVTVKVGAYEMGGGWGKENKKTRTRKRGALARVLRMRLLTLNPKP